MELCRITRPVVVVMDPLPAVQAGVESCGLKDVTPAELIGALELTLRAEPVLELIADGLANNGEIAERLFISEKTVKTHVSNGLGKLGAADRTQAAVYAWGEPMKRPG